MSKQSNRSTQFPLFYVYEKEEIWVDGDASSDKTVFVNEEGDDTTEEQDENENTWVLEEGNWADKWKCKETGEEIDGYEAEEKFKLHRCSVKIVDKPVVNVGPFFTEEAARNHITSNNYHYNEPFIYVNSAWRNWEMQEYL
jgi:hypothetical protein